MDIILEKNSKENVMLTKQIYETEEQFINKVVFYLCCIDSGIDHDRAEMLCNSYRNRQKYNVKYHDQIEEQLNQITQKYNIK